MTPKQAATYLGLSEFYLRNMRQFMHEHDGPEYTMIRRTGKLGGGQIADYTKEALDAWSLTHKWRKRRKSVELLTNN